MRTLYILRHAKAASPPGIEDRDRPLEDRGRTAAQAVADGMREREYRPAFTLCSPSVRTRQTLKPILAHWPDLTVSYAEDLYLATAGTLFAFLQQVDDRQESTLLVGHNPGIHGIVQLLAGGGDKDALARIAGGYPTGCLSVLECDCASWRELQPGANRLAELFVGKELA